MTKTRHSSLSCALYCSLNKQKYRKILFWRILFARHTSGVCGICGYKLTGRPRKKRVPKSARFGRPFGYAVSLPDSLIFGECAFAFFLPMQIFFLFKIPRFAEPCKWNMIAIYFLTSPPQFFPLFPVDKGLYIPKFSHAFTKWRRIIGKNRNALRISASSKEKNLCPAFYFTMGWG